MNPDLDKRSFAGDFQYVVTEIVNELQAELPDPQTTAWFLLRYLRRIRKSCAEPPTAYAVTSSMRALLRFYVDSVEARSDLGQRCNLIFEAYRQARRQEQQDSE